MFPDSDENRALHRATESGFSVSGWLHNMAAPSLGGQELQTPTLCPLSHPPGSRAEGLFPSPCWPHCKAHPQALIPSGFHRLLPNSRSWSQRNVEQSLEFFSAKKQVLSNSEFHSGLLSSHIAGVCKAQAFLSKPGGDFSPFIFFSCWQGCKTP